MLTALFLLVRMSDFTLITEAVMLAKMVHTSALCIYAVGALVCNYSLGQTFKNGDLLLFEGEQVAKEIRGVY